jgi:hypothetical protein
MYEYKAKRLNEIVNPDKSRTIIAEITPSVWNSEKGVYYDESQKFMQAFKFWMPESGLKDAKSFFKLTFPNFSDYLGKKYGDINVSLGLTDDNFVNEFPMSVRENYHYNTGDIRLVLSTKEGVKFGNIQINYTRVKDEKLICEKFCNFFNEFRYIPSLQPEIPDSDFFKIIKHQIMNITYCDNRKQKTNKKLILNEKEFYDALDMQVNRKHENDSWRMYSNSGIISKKNEKRDNHLFLWDFWAGWGHGTKMTAFSCHKCSDSPPCKGDTDSGKIFCVENTKQGLHTYEPLNIKIPFP